MSKRFLIFFALFILILPCLRAGGWNNTLMGWKALGLGGAFVAVADDPSAIFHNPAGLVFQKENLNFSIGGYSVRPTHIYIMPTGERAQSELDSSLPQFFFSFRTSEKLTLGFGFYVPFAGGGVDWKEDELGYPFKSTLGIYALTPTLAYQFSDKLSIGLNLNFYRSLLNVDMVSEESGPIKTEESGSAFSAGLGLMYRPSEKIGIGLSIRGPSRMKLSGKTTINATIPGYGSVEMPLDSETCFNLPWDVDIGLSYRISENILFSTSAQYTMWKRLDKVEKMIESVPTQGDVRVDEDMKFENILVLRAGIECHVFGGVFLRGGIGLDRSATPDETLNFKNIDVDKLTLLGGIGYRTGRMQIDFVYAYASGKEREKVVPGFPLAEKYNLNVSLMGVGLTFSF